MTCKKKNPKDKEHKFEFLTHHCLNPKVNLQMAESACKGPSESTRELCSQGRVSHVWLCTDCRVLFGSVKVGGFSDVGGEAKCIGVDWGSVGSEPERWGLRTELGPGRWAYKFPQRGGTSRLTTEPHRNLSSALNACGHRPLPGWSDRSASAFLPPRPHPGAHSTRGLNVVPALPEGGPGP